MFKFPLLPGRVKGFFPPVFYEFQGTQYVGCTIERDEGVLRFLSQKKSSVVFVNGKMHTQSFTLSKMQDLS